MEIEEIDYKNFGKCVRLTNGIIDAIVTIDYGPRIIYFGFCGKENIFYEDSERSHRVFCENAEEKADPQKTFYYYGGHRLWLSSERSARTIIPDNSPVVYSILADSVRFSTPRPKNAVFQTGFEVFISEDTADIMVSHTVKNVTKEAQPCGLWPITMLEGDGVVVLPQNADTSDDFRPNRALVLWPGTQLHDDRIFIGTRFLTIKKDTEHSAPLKIGCNNVFGWAAFVGPRYTFLKRYVHDVQAVYPDFGSSCEIGLQKDYTEIQSMSPMYRVEPGQEIKHVENLSIYLNANCLNEKDENAIEKYIENLKNSYPPA
jgi:hypothetical protein